MRKDNILLVWLQCICFLLLITLRMEAQERKQLFDNNWHFALGDYEAADRFDFDDAAWQKLNLPHDWSIEAGFDVQAPAGNDGGYLPAGIGWYRKTFTLPKASAEKRIALYFEGVYMNSEVFVNGHSVGKRPYGYSSFCYDITPYVYFGKPNVVAVRVDNSQQKNCRWYSGSGIYRHVWLLITHPIHFEEWGTFIRSSRLENGDDWQLDIDATYVGEMESGNKLEVRHIVCDAEGKVVATSSGGVKQSFRITRPRMWSPDSPYLYRVKSQLVLDKEVVDEVEHTTGFRTITVDSHEGLRLNGESVLLNGGCVHHDNGILGACSFDAAEARKVRLLKEAGFNAVRTAHNVPSEAFLHECDRQGLLVIDEAFDGWRDKKNDYDYHDLFDEWWQRDMEAMVCRDRNHPSIFCWSTGNEVIERKKLEVVTTARKLAALCHRLDPTRPVTSALASWDNDWEIYDPLAAEHDITGYNYMIHKSEEDHERVPDRVMMQTESYPNDAWKNYRKTKDHPYIIGDFVWTAVDYLGESGIGRWYYEGDVPGEHYHRPLYPWHAAYCGDIDLTGFRKPVSHYRSMLWNENGEQLYVAVREPDGYRGKIHTTLWGTWPTFESWNWPGHEGKDIDVEVYSRYPLVRLYLNDRLVGEKPAEEMKAVFTLPYEPGVLRAEGICKGEIAETRILKSAGKVADIRLTADRMQLRADGQDLSFITVEMIDDDGNWVPTADNSLTVAVDGVATLQAIGNADIKDEDPYFDATHKVWKGRALAVIRNTGKRGKAVVKIKFEDANGNVVTKAIQIQCR